LIGSRLVYGGRTDNLPAAIIGSQTMVYNPGYSLELFVINFYIQEFSLTLTAIR
jgi:hypothetical protein